MPRALEQTTQNRIMVASFGQANATWNIGAMLNSQDILLAQLYYGVVSNELDTSQPYADITQVRFVPDINGDVKYIFLDRNGNRINSMQPATSANGDFTGAGDIKIGGAGAQNDRFDLATGQVTRAVVTGNEPWANQRGLLVVKPTEGSALVQKTEELGRVSNIVGMLTGLLSAQQSTKSAWVNALR